MKRSSPQNSRLGANRQRAGVSAVIATTIILGITVALGLGLISFANIGVGTATKQYAEDVGEYGRFASDKFVVPSVAFDNPANNDLTVFVFNSGRFETTIDAVLVSVIECPTSFAPVRLIAPDDMLNPGSEVIASNDMAELQFRSIGLNFVGNSDCTYQVQVISDTGYYQTIYQKY